MWLEVGHSLCERELTCAVSSVPAGSVRAEGIIRNLNTLDAFKTLDKSEVISNAARQVRFHFKPGIVLLAYMHADLGCD